jgi:hypothetical protein
MSRALKNDFVRQRIVYTGGGMVLSPHARKIIKELPDVSYWSDNTEWSLACYLAGLRSYRYRGSESIHRICGSGGRKSWVKQSEVVMPNPKYVTVRPSNKAGELGCIPVDADLTAEARTAHRIAYAALPR